MLQVPQSLLGAGRRNATVSAAVPAVGVVLLAPAVVWAHAPSELAKQRMLEGNLFDVAWLGAEHMLTGYDHLLFLLGVLFFLSRPVQIVSFITAFTLGHTLVLLTATPLGIGANPHLIDAFIALTVIYKAFENLDGFRHVLRVNAPPLLPMVFLFGLIHGFGLSTRLQQMALAQDPEFFPKILAFNVGVELGQLAALAAMGTALFLWRETRGWRTFARVANVSLICAGVSLFALQVQAFSDARRPGAVASAPVRTNVGASSPASSSSLPAAAGPPPLVRASRLIGLRSPSPETSS